MQGFTVIASILFALGFTWIAFDSSLFSFHPCCMVLGIFGFMASALETIKARYSVEGVSDRSVFPKLHAALQGLSIKLVQSYVSKVVGAALIFLGFCAIYENKVSIEGLYLILRGWEMGKEGGNFLFLIV